jgi:hypothetical protein
MQPGRDAKFCGYCDQIISAASKYDRFGRTYFHDSTSAIAIEDAMVELGVRSSGCGLNFPSCDGEVAAAKEAMRNRPDDLKLCARLYERGQIMKGVLVDLASVDLGSSMADLSGC